MQPGPSVAQNAQTLHLDWTERISCGKLLHSHACDAPVAELNRAPGLLTLFLWMKRWQVKNWLSKLKIYLLRNA